MSLLDFILFVLVIFTYYDSFTIIRWNEVLKTSVEIRVAYDIYIYMILHSPIYYILLVAQQKY